MEFNWEDYLKLAKFLNGDETVEVEIESKKRSSISRSYYAAFNKAKQYLKIYKSEPIRDDGSAHEYVISYFQDSSNLDYISIGTKLNNLRENRGKADYVGVVTGISSLADISLHFSSEIINYINSLE